MRFKGGVHPDYHKETATLAVETLPLAVRYAVPLAQHLGAPGTPIVAKGQKVAKGEPLSTPQGFVSVPVHAPTSGTVKAVKDWPHPLGRNLPAVEIEADGEDRLWEGLAPLGDWRRLEAAALREALKNGGLVGMGGATFPTHVKLSPPADKPIDTFILNGAECEPYLTSDHRVMLEQAAAVMEGVGLMARVLGVKRVVVGVEANKPDALAALRGACPADVAAEFVLLEAKYPQGSEKHLIYALTGRSVPAGGLPMDVGCLVQNVGTAVAAWAAVQAGLPLIERVTTVTGEGIARPANLRLRVGTPARRRHRPLRRPEADRSRKVIFGGPMMGMGQFNLEVPVIKGTSGILCLPAERLSQFLADPCIRCGACVDACPMGLVPSAMGVLAERNRFADLADYRVGDCIECGSCAYVCPSFRPLVQLFRRGKAELKAEQSKRGAA